MGQSTGRTNPLHHQVWTVLLGVAAVAFWIVGVGAGWRGWLLVDDDGISRGIVAHAQAFGTEATVWWVPAAILTLTTWVVSFGVMIVRHLVADPAAVPPVPPRGPDRLPPGSRAEPGTGTEAEADETEAEADETEATSP